jgi:hypothetical protein
VRAGLSMDDLGTAERAATDEHEIASLKDASTP